ncbi:MAG: uridine kinase [Bacilli bacterium]|nr:uridine kinase [Bacilli bacterium]
MPAIILVGGGSSSGKSYLTRAVSKALDPEKVTLLTLDDYYKDQTNVPMEDRLKVNYDHPNAFDWPLMRDHIRKLKEGQPIEKPIYDFVNHTRSDRTETIVPKDLVVAEGIMALVDRKLRDLGDLCVFIQAKPERRFLRRMIRDTRERGRTMESIVSQYFATVQPMYDEVVEPSSIYADLIVNNDGVANLAIDVLTVVFNQQLVKVSKGTLHKRAMSDEFTNEVFASLFAKED